MWVNTVSVVAAPTAADHKIQKERRKVFKYNTVSTNSITLYGEAMGEVDIFYLVLQNHR